MHTLYDLYLLYLLDTVTLAATLPVAIISIVSKALNCVTVRTAGSVTIALPAVLLSQTYIVRGLTFGAVKG